MSVSITFSFSCLSASAFGPVLCSLSVSLSRVSFFLSGSFSHGVLALQAQVGTKTSNPPSHGFGSSGGGQGAWLEGRSVEDGLVGGGSGQRGGRIWIPKE